MRTADPYSAAGVDGQRLGKQGRFIRYDRDQNFCWRFLVIIELAKESCQNSGIIAFGIMRQEIGPVAIVRPAANEKSLDTGFLATAGKGDDVGIMQVRDIDILICLDAAERADAVAPDGGCFKFQRFSAACMRVA